MNIERNAVVVLDIELWDLWGNLMQTTEAPIAYLHGGYDNIFPAVETALEGHRTGDKIEVRLEPEDAFGDYDEELLRVEPRSAFPQSVEVGMQFEGMPGEESGAGESSQGDEGDEGDEPIYTVTDIADDKVVLDGNHPLAGAALNFVCTVVSVRLATADEIEQGYAEDPSSNILRLAH